MFEVVVFEVGGEVYNISVHIGLHVTEKIEKYIDLNGGAITYFIFCPLSVFFLADMHVVGRNFSTLNYRN